MNNLSKSTLFRLAATVVASLFLGGIASAQAAQPDTAAMLKTIDQRSNFVSSD